MSALLLSHVCQKALAIESWNMEVDGCMQISKALLTEDQKLKLPRFLEDEVRDPEATKQVSVY